MKAVRKAWWLAGVLGGGGGRPGGGRGEAAGRDRRTPRVVVSSPPLDSFAKNLVADPRSVVCLCVTTGPHQYSYTIQDTQLLKEADLFLANGLGLDDSFADK